MLSRNMSTRVTLVGNLWPVNSMYLTDLTGKDVHCYYCPNCTTHIYHHAEVMGDQVIVRTGLLDEGRKSFGAGIELYGKDRMGWVKESAPTFPVFPPA